MTNAHWRFPKPIIPGDGNIYHGTNLGYTMRDCRCPDCLHAIVEYKRLIRLKRHPRMFKNHGTVTGYTDWNCRCDLCTEASTQYQKEYRARRKNRT